jgi:preprotein translocase subunit YajC
LPLHNGAPALYSRKIRRKAASSLEERLFRWEELMPFITPAFAQDAAAPAGGFLVQILPFIMILGIMYFLIIRPQQKRLKEHRDMIGSIKRGDTVVTSGGIIGKVSRVIGESELQVEIADGVRVRVVRSTVSEVRTRGDARDAEAKKVLARADNDDDLQAGNDDHPEGAAPKPAGQDRAANTDV